MRLSVSPVGSSCLQLEPALEPARLEPAIFQYPRSDRVVCNQPLVRRCRNTRCFQYPRSDRVVCNQTEGFNLHRVLQLSVSPVGSSCLQHNTDCLA